MQGAKQRGPSRFCGTEGLRSQAENKCRGTEGRERCKSRKMPGLGSKAQPPAEARERCDPASVCRSLPKALQYKIPELTTTAFPLVSICWLGWRWGGGTWDLKTFDGHSDKRDNSPASTKRIGWQDHSVACGYKLEYPSHGGKCLLTRTKGPFSGHSSLHAPSEPKRSLERTRHIAFSAGDYGQILSWCGLIVALLQGSANCGPQAG